MIMPGNTFWVVLSAIELILLLLCLLLFIKRHRAASLLKPSDDNHAEDVELILYQRFGKKWEDVFSHISYPITEDEKQEIVALVWLIASATIDCLVVSNDSPNILRRNRDMYNYLKGDSDEVQNLKPFYHDPSTVPHQVIAVYDIMKELGFKGTIIAFGYRLKIE